MGAPILPDEARLAADTIRQADLVIGIPSYNNGSTIGHVVRAAFAGLAKYFPQLTSVVINSDGGSSDRTRDQVLSARVEDSHLMLLATPLAGAHRLSIPYHGIPGKGSAFRLIFQMARELGAKACAVVDSDLRSITPEWIDLLLRPILLADYDLVAPYYHRHKYDGTITNSIVYPLTRALYGLSVRQPIGGEFGLSARLVNRYLARNDWETDVARYGIDVWMTTVAIAEKYRVCQSFLGAKLHDAKDPAADLSAMLQQVVGSVFALMEEYEEVWQRTGPARPAELFGFRFEVGLDPIAVNVERMRQLFCRGFDELGEIWALALQPETIEGIRRLRSHEGACDWRIEDELWVRTIYDFACAHKRRALGRGHLLKSLTPLYLGRVASFVEETRDMLPLEVEERIEHLCRCFERGKPYLAGQWEDGTAPPFPREVSRDIPRAAETTTTGG